MAKRVVIGWDQQFEDLDASTGVSDELQILDMRFMKYSPSKLRVVKGRKGYADIANKTCIRSDLVKEWADVSTGRRRRCGGEYFWELEAVIRIEPASPAPNFFGSCRPGVQRYA